MELKIEKNRIYSLNQDGKLVTELLFPADGNQSVCFTRTFVDDSLRGQGVANKLMETGIEQLRSSGRKAHATCSYAVKWFSTHPEEAKEFLLP